MIKVKKILATVVFSAMIASSSSSASGMGLWQVSTSKSLFNVSISGHTTANQITTTTEYGLKKGKYVKSLTIRLVEGDYDKSKSTGSGDISISKKNNPFQTARTFWHWTYK